jgi:hypothetical protein
MALLMHLGVSLTLKEPRKWTVTMYCVLWARRLADKHFQSSVMQAFAGDLEPLPAIP